MKKIVLAALAAVSIGLGGCVTTGSPYGGGFGSAPLGNPGFSSVTRGESLSASRVTEARVLAMRPVTLQGEASYTGQVLGGTIGAVAGSNVGKGSGRYVATVAGGALGAVAGAAIEKAATQKDAFEFILERASDGRKAAVAGVCDGPCPTVGDLVYVLEYQSGRVRIMKK